MGAFLPTVEQLAEFNSARYSARVSGIEPIHAAVPDFGFQPHPIPICTGDECTVGIRAFQTAECLHSDDQIFRTRKVLSESGVAAKLWLGGYVYYDVSHLTTEQKSAWLNATQTWQSATRCIYFRDIVNFPAASDRITVKSVRGHSGSQIGAGTYNVHIKECQWFNGRTLLHEIGHALGLVHEHQRSDRCGNVTVKIQTVDYRRYPSTLNITDYDFDSIMHYPEYRDGTHVIKPCRPVSNLGTSKKLSCLDVDAVIAAYARKGEEGGAKAKRL